MQFPDYPFKSNFLSVKGHRMHYLDEGDPAAAPVVMVHGNPTWSFFFRRPLLALRDTCRCVAPDHIGMGLSDKPGATDYGYRLNDRIDDLEALLQELGIRERITLLLHDWGGMIGMGYACRHPERIKALVILNTAAFPLPRQARLPWQLRLARSALGAPLVQGLNAFCRGALEHCSVRGPLDADVRRAYLAPYDNWHQRLGVLRFVQDIPLAPDHPSYALVQRIDQDSRVFQQTPMLICWGMRDFVFTPAFLQAWRERFPQAQVHAYDNAGHYLLEDAADEVIASIQRFLQQQCNMP